MWVVAKPICASSESVRHNLAEAMFRCEQLSDNPL